MKVSGSYASLVQGVSQQENHTRRPGQHTEVINMIPDPVLGLVRRPGVRWIADKALSALFPLLPPVKDYRTFEYTADNTDYALIYRIAAGANDPIIVYNKTAGTFLNVVRDASDVVYQAINNGGVSAITAVGKFVLMAPNTLNPVNVAVNEFTKATGLVFNDLRATAWCRGGAYGKTYTLTVNRTGFGDQVVDYTTPTIQYPETLNTQHVPVLSLDPLGGTETTVESMYRPVSTFQRASKLRYGLFAPSTMVVTNGQGINLVNSHPAAPTGTQYSWAPGAAEVMFPATTVAILDTTASYSHRKVVTNPNYTDIVTTLTAEYNAAVTAWIQTAAVQSTPEYIMGRLSLKLSGFATGPIPHTLRGNSIQFTDVKTLAFDDDGDGSLVRAVGNTVNGIDQLSDFDSVGRVVRIKPTNSAESFYVVATAKSGVGAYGDWIEVLWVESAGTTNTVDPRFLLGVTNGSTFHLGRDSASLVVSGYTPGAPSWAKSGVGDALSEPPPHFIGRKVTYLGTFQDRLLIGSDAVLRASRTSDYFNLFRSSLLTVRADDAFEMLAQGTEDDTFLFGQNYDRDLIIFGSKRQYAISGRIPFTPTSANLAVMSSHANAAGSPPLAVGGQIFHSVTGESYTAVSAIVPGRNPESPESYPVSSQLRGYIAGDCTEFAQHNKPTTLMVRTAGATKTLYVFSYLDIEGQGRVQDAWHKWTYADDVIGVTSTKNGPVVFFAVQNPATGANYVVAGEQTMLPTTIPYLDLWRLKAQAGTGSMPSTGQLGASQLASVASDLTGQAWPVEATTPTEPLLVPRVGRVFSSLFVPSTPIVRDRNDKPIRTGKLTVTRLLASTVESYGVSFICSYRKFANFFFKEFPNRVYGGRVINQAIVNDTVLPLTVLTVGPLGTVNASLPVGHNTDDYDATILSRWWLPLRLTDLQWVGQFFNRTQRI